MTNSAVAHKALEYRRLRLEMKALEKRSRELSEAVVAELAKREVAVLEHKGVRVTVKTTTRLTYDVDALRSCVPADVFARVTRPVVDAAAMVTEIEMGRLRAIDVGPASTETVSSPYIVVTGEAAA